MRVVIVVDNPVVGDSRVQKQARSAMAAGHDVIVVGLSAREVVGPDSVNGIPVLRFTVPSRYYTWEHRGRLLREAEAVTIDHAAAVTEYSARRRAAAEIDGARLSARTWKVRGSVAPLLSKARRAPRRAGRAIGGSLRRLVGRAVPRWWRLSSAHLVDLENVLVPILVGLAPDLIHANDPQVLGAAVRARTLLSTTKKVFVVYDAHEWWQAVASGELIHHVGAYGIEQKHARDADAVVTVTADIASRLQKRYRLAAAPTVVRNLPLSGSEPAPQRATIREELGLEGDIPLLVYSGAMHARRGVAEAVSSLTELPGVHLAIVTGKSQSDLRDVLALADRLGVMDRVHVRTYVPSRSVSWYLTGATLGLSPMRRHPNHDLAVPTKLAEYLHAGLPLIVSDCPAQAQFVRERQVGEVYRAGDAEDLARAVQKALKNVAVLSAEARAAATELNWEHDAAHLLDLYQTLAGTKRSSSVRSGDLVLGDGRIAEALITTGSATLSPDEATTAAAIETLLRARDSDRLVVIGVPRVLETFAQPLRTLNFLESSGTRTALVLDRELEDDGLLGQVLRLVTSPHLVDRLAHATWLPLVASREALAAGVARVPDAPVRRIAYDGATLDPSWISAVRVVAERADIETVDSNAWEPADIFVDSLPADQHTELRVDHLAAGAAVITRPGHTASEHPVLTAPDAASLGQIIDRLVTDPSARSAAGREGATFAAEHHTPAAARTTIDRLLA